MFQDKFNVELLIPDHKGNDNFRILGEVSKPNIFIYGKNEFDPDGLYSDEIFGVQGSMFRNTRPGYINIKTPIYHPLIYKTIISLKKSYKDIIESKLYVKFNKDIMDFEEDEDGYTGYHYFVSNFDNVILHDNNSDQRLHKIKLINKYKGKENLLIKWLVIPAGLRDYRVNKKGQPEEDEINSLYRSLLFSTTILNNIKVTDSNIKDLDMVRLRIQNNVVAIYDYLQGLIGGGDKFIEEKWAKRAVAFGTRNVLTPAHTTIYDLDSVENYASFNDTVVGLLQFIKGLQPVVIGKVRVMLDNIFNDTTQQAVLVNKKTMNTELVRIKDKEKDAWLSTEGLTNTINKLLNRNILMSSISVNEDYYLLLVYDDGYNIKILYNYKNTDEYDKKYIRPITYIEFFYLCVYGIRNKYPAFVTRYPIIGLGSIYPSKIYLKTTTEGRTVSIEDTQGLWIMGDNIVYEYPILEQQPISGMSVHTSKIGRLDADFDGDVLSVNFLYTEESIQEINNMLKSKSFYITTEGNLVSSMAGNVPLNLVFQHCTC